MRHADRRRTRRRPALTGLGAALWLLAGGAWAETALVAVATSFADVMARIEADFEARTPHLIDVTAGSTGKLYGQITRGAPFDVLLAADRHRPELLEAAGYAVAGSRFTYATGRLTLWSPDPHRVPADGAAFLESESFTRLAMANPDLAPFGAAAVETLRALGVWEAVRGRIVIGQNAGQAYALTATGNAEVGLVALSSVLSRRRETPGSRWDVPESLHAPIHQDAVLLARAEDNAAARDLLAYLRRPEVRELIRSAGYGVD